LKARASFLKCKSDHVPLLLQNSSGFPSHPELKPWVSTMVYDEISYTCLPASSPPCYPLLCLPGCPRGIHLSPVQPLWLSLTVPLAPSLCVPFPSAWKLFPNICVTGFYEHSRGLCFSVTSWRGLRWFLVTGCPRLSGYQS
jgi:hypothetical protein